MSAKGDQPTRGKMGRIDQLPPDIRELVNRRLREGASQADIIKETAPLLAARGLPPLSRSGVNRYTSKVERAGQRIREAREAAAAWAATAEEGAGDVGRHTIEVLRTLALDMAHQAQERQDDDQLLSPTEMKDLALALQRLESAGEHSVKRERQMRRVWQEKAEAKLKQTAKQAGLTDDAIQLVRQIMAGEI